MTGAFEGVILGTAVGDAIALPYEGLRPGRIARMLRGPLRPGLLAGQVRIPRRRVESS